MKSLTHGNIKTAVGSLRTTKWRSFLTMLGIIIGVASVITIVSIGQGVKQQVGQQVKHFGQDLITIRPGSATSGGIGTLANTSSGTLTSKDITAVQNTAGVGESAPLALVAGMVTASGGGIYRDGVVIAAGEDLPDMLNQSLAFGGFYTRDDTDSALAVLGKHAAEAMFSEDVPLGQSFTFRGQQFIVRGIFNEFNVPTLSNDVNFDNAIFIPYGMAQQLTNGTSSAYQILAKPSKPSGTDRAVTALQASLLRVHGDAHDFSVLKQNQTLATTNDILDLLTTLIAGVAAVSLLVGGIGIMNIMLVSVTERMHEIGIRKAVGATNRQILSQFMTEATVLSVTGGLIGIVLAYIGDLCLRLFTSLTPIISWQIVVLATGVSIAVGIIFGSAPAVKAARKDPISALRNE